MTLLLRLVPADCWRESWHHATSVVGGLFLALATLGLLRATEPWGAWLLALSTGSH